MDTRVPPHSNEAEQNVLGSVFIDQDTIKTILDRLDTEDFYTRSHKTIYKAIQELYKESVDIDYTTLINRLETQNLLADVGGTDYILALSDTTPSVVNLEHYIDIVKDKAVVRRMIDAAKEIAEQGFQAANMTDYIDESERKVFNVASARRTSQFVTLKDAAKEVIEKTETAKNTQGTLLGLDTGFEELNFYTYGLQPSELYIIAARPSMGKSAFALNIATNVARLNKSTVAFFSLEMGVDQLVGRMISSEANVKSSHLRTGNLEPTEWQQISLANDQLRHLDILFDDSGTVKVTDLRQKCRKLAQEGNLDLVVIDYLQLLSGSEQRQHNRVQEVSEISRTLKEMARELKVPVIALSQLSRNVENRNDKRPILADLRESGSIEQDADVILFLFREDYYKQENQSLTDEVDIMVAKNRSGAINPKGFKLIFKKQYSRFRDKTPSAVAESQDRDLPDT